MKYIKLYICLFLLINQSIFSNISIVDESNYIEKYKPITESLSKEFGIPFEVIMAVAIMESGSGTSKIARQLNNHFGIVGKNNVKWSRFKQYENAEASYRDFCEKMSAKKFYQKLKGNANHLIWIDKISRTGYSTHPKKWRKMIVRTIKKNNLRAISLESNFVN